MAEQAQVITNKDRYPGSTFLEKFTPYAQGDGATYLLVGYEDGDRDTPLVAENRPDGKLHATPFWELLKFSQGAISLIEQSGNGTQPG